MSLFSNSARIAAMVAGAGLVFSPLAASAAPQPRRTVPITLPLSHAPAWSVADETAEHRRWNRHRHRDGIDGGDVLGGLLVIGGIAAIAAAISKDKQERRGDRVERAYRDDDAGYGDEPDRAPDYGNVQPGETDRAVKACTAEAARNGRVDEVFEVDKVDGEWRVRGDYADGAEFDCTVDASGRAYVGNGDSGDDWDRRNS